MRKAVRAVVFFIILAGLVMVLNNLTLNRRSEGCIQLSEFYEMEEDSIDLLCIGSSHIYYGINTCRLYDEYGIASYLLASPGQPVWLSYYLLEEALKTQEPELVLFDIGTLYRKEEDFGAYSWETLISMKPSYTKWKAIQAVNQYQECVDAVGAFLSFPYYHTRYAALTSEDFENTQEIRYHGYKPDFTVITEKELKKWEGAVQGITDTLVYPKGEKPITERTEEHLRKLIDLCQEKDIPLLLVNAPYANEVDEKREADAYISRIAQEYGVPLIYGNNFRQEMQIDFAADLLDASHLNYYGSVKYTDYLAAWIDENCSLPDRRGNEGYQSWQEASELFWEQVMS